MLFYKPLLDGDIRLLRIHPGSDTDFINCDLETFAAEQTPPYNALSYVWGDPDGTEDISINGEIFHATTNLHDALWQLRAGVNDRHLSTGIKSWLWVDAICLNQADAVEKLVQIPRMSAIFSSAELVICWLGLSDGLDEHAIEALFSLGSSIWYQDWGGRSYSDLISFIRRTSPATELDHLYRPAKTAFLRIIEHPWFQRVWTFQEFALAKEASFIIGRCATDLGTLVTLHLTLLISETGSPYAHKLDVSEHVINFERGYNSTIGHKEQDRTLHSFALRLHRIMCEMSGRLTSTLRHDTLYGLFGLAYAPELPPHLAPDYGSPYAQICEAYTRFLIIETGDISILSNRSPSPQGAPSWTVDFSGTIYERVYAKSSARTNFKFSEDGQRLELDGVELKVYMRRMILPTQSEVDDDRTTSLHRLLAEFEELLAISSARRGLSFQKVLYTWIKTLWFVTWGTSTATMAYDQLSPRAHFHTDDIHGAVNLDTPRGREELHEAVLHLRRRILRELTDFEHFVSEDGLLVRLVRSGPQAYDKDVFCMFKGSSSAFVLRPCPKGYRIISSCEIIAISPEDLGESFFEGKGIETFVLV